MASQLPPHPLITKTTTHAGEPSYHTTATATGHSDEHVAYDIGFASIILLFIIILIYTCFMCNRWKHSRSPPPPTTDSDSDSDFHSIILSSSLQDDILSNFPTFVYSETAVKPRKLDTDDNLIHDSGCPICLADYESVDVLRVLPECGHLFHIRCIDTWLEVNLICPVCRKSPLPA
ncbi:hypothetical protein SSX86_002755 [Deinandra increscens subsp. villosa]|uniref:RING-type domain-containing protein n=1 Tax=Deinandra increscens subsp. villosa TaxID=3103831 RepID=A0AAP0DX14_9ASTR